MLTTLIIAAVALITGFAASHVRTRRRLTRTRTDLAHARRLVELDSLTGLTNRTGAQNHHHRRTTAGHQLAAVLLDLDDFKSVNDAWGHQTGDAHLVAVAERLAEACAPIGGHASRLAGDEFLLLLPHTRRALPGVPFQVTAVLARLSTPLTLHVEGGTAVITPRASAGIALPEPGSTWTDLLRRADIALYHAKAEKGRAMLHTPDMRHPSPTYLDQGTWLREHEMRRLRLPAVQP